MSVMEVVELIDAMEEKFGVTAAAAAVPPLRPQLAATPVRLPKSRPSSTWF
jgi:ribosomal protein L7/L12